MHDSPQAGKLVQRNFSITLLPAALLPSGTRVREGAKFPHHDVLVSIPSAFGALFRALYGVFVCVLLVSSSAQIYPALFFFSFAVGLSFLVTW